MSEKLEPFPIDDEIDEDLLDDEEESRIKVTIAGLIKEYLGEDVGDIDADDFAQYIVECVEEMDFIITDVLDG